MPINLDLSGLSKKPPHILSLSPVSCPRSYGGSSPQTSPSGHWVLVASPTAHKNLFLLSPPSFLGNGLPSVNLCLYVCLFDLHLQSNYICISLFHSHISQNVNQGKSPEPRLRDHFIWELVLFECKYIVTYHHISRK